MTTNEIEIYFNSVCTTNNDCHCWDIVEELEKLEIVVDEEPKEL